MDKVLTLYTQPLLTMIEGEKMRVRWFRAWIVAVGLAALGCGFNWSMQHNDRHWRKECWHEAKTADLLH